MNLQQNYADNPLNWSLPLGRVSGILIRVHLLFILWIIFESSRHLADGAVWALSWLTITLVFFCVVLIHEFGHCFGARSVGGDADEILMWPLGGLATVQAPMTPRAQFITTAAGPLVNVIFCLIAATLLLILRQSVMLNPLNQFAVSSSILWKWGPADWLVIFWSVNYIILLFNLLPVFPMDGGKLLQAILWKYAGFHQATMTATFIGMIGAITFGLFGLIANQYLLVAIAIFGYMTCWQQRQLLKAGELQPDNEWMTGGLGQDEKQPSFLQRRKAKREAQKIQRAHQQQLEAEQRIDTILEKVHQQGMHTLTRSEKKILEQATQRKKQP